MCKAFDAQLKRHAQEVVTCVSAPAANTRTALFDVFKFACFCVFKMKATNMHSDIFSSSKSINALQIIHSY